LKGPTRDFQLKVGSDPLEHNIHHLTFLLKGEGPGTEFGTSGTEAADATNAPDEPYY